MIAWGVLQADQVVIKGQVVSAKTGQPIELVQITVPESERGTVSDSQGQFSFAVPALPVKLKFLHIAYQKKTLTAKQSDIGIVRLASEVLTGEEVIVSANRAIEGKTPAAFSTLTSREIETHYTVEDVPMILATEPGVYAYSESGNGTGYSYVNIRGFDQSRIAVMLDNVPLNDNESHQVYWVDHADILSNARDVQIQRGIGNSLYGSSAFGGSINVITKIGSQTPELSATLGAGSYNTRKYRLEGHSGDLLGNNFNATLRASRITSQGYREYHNSRQNAFFAGLEHSTHRMKHQFRALVGYENTDLNWWGVPAEHINDREQRRQGYQAYTDDFLQQIYSLNSFYILQDNLFLRNVVYWVDGSGYYENQEVGDYYSYNLDIMNTIPDVAEDTMTTRMLRRRWIINHYYGIIPTLTWKRSRSRVDIGGELRRYQGDHFGEVTDFSVSELTVLLGEDWYTYYQYLGQKILATAFMHVTYTPFDKLSITGDLQYQTIDWTLDQQDIGHAPGYQLSANWDFLNPRIGLIYNFTEQFSVFTNYGKAQKEPADNQIIEADDVWSEPQKAAAEVINDYEAGVKYNHSEFVARCNLYHIQYFNEQLKNIDIEQEGEYAYYAAEATIHRGLEFSFQYSPGTHIGLKLNGSLNQNYFSSGTYKNNILPHYPIVLSNLILKSKPLDKLHLYTTVQYVGQQYIDRDNRTKIDGYTLVNMGAELHWHGFTITGKVNNVFNVLYATHGAKWGDCYYWPGATRNAYLALSYAL